MKITDLRYTPVYVPIEAPLVYSQGAHAGFTRIIVELETDEGLVGLGECYGGKAREGQLEEFRQAVIGEDPFALERLRWKLGAPAMLKIFGQVLPSAAIEFACLDLQGQMLGLPVSELIGGRLRDRVPCCAYLFYRHANGDGNGRVDDADDLVATARDLVDRYGFQTLKYKNGVKHPDEEIETVIALRRAFPRHAIRVDPNAAWSVSTSLRVARRLTDCDLEYLEDPTWGMRGLSRVNQKAPWMPLASNMSVFSMDDLVPNLQLDVIDVVLLDPHWYGGISRARLAGQMCEVGGVDVGLHSGAELGVSLAAMLHLAAVLPNLAVAIDTHYHYLQDDVIAGGPFAFADGGVAVPTGPGLGVELDRDKLARYAELAPANESPWTEDPARIGHIAYLPRW